MNKKLTPLQGASSAVHLNAETTTLTSARYLSRPKLRMHLFGILALMLASLFSSSAAFAQISVTVTNNTNTTPNLATNYASLEAALNDLNAVTAMSGPVTLALAAGSETAPIKGFVLGSASLNPVLSATNTITLDATGVVTLNAGVGTSNGPTASPDGIFILNGADHVTLDGITFSDGNNTTATVAMEFGVALFKRTVGDGSNNNTIQNCIFNMQRLNNVNGSGPLVEGSVAIGVYNSTFAAATTALTPTNGATLATNGTNSNNRFYTNTINGGNYGIALSGFGATLGVGPAPTATTFLGDLNNDIGGSSAGTGNSILNFGGGAAATNPAAGIRANFQWGVNLSYNTLNNNNGSGVNHLTTLRGIFAQAGTSANATITNNNVTIKGGATTTIVTGIENSIGATAAGNTITITNNTITGDYLTATTGAFIGISSSSTADTVNVNNNTVQNITYSVIGNTGTGAVTGILLGGAGTNRTANANTVNNITRTGSTGGTTVGININGGTNQTAQNNVVTNLSIDGTGTGSTMYGIQTGTGIVVVNNNQINNLTCTKTTGTGNLYAIYNFGSPTNENFNNNTLHTITHNGTGTTAGILLNTAIGVRTVSGNTIHTITGAGNAISGMSLTTSSPNVFNNKIYNIESTSATAPVVSGIVVVSVGTSGSVNIYNNVIGDLKAPSASSASVSLPSVRGINLTLSTASSNVGVFNNSVHLEATSTGTNFGTAALFATSNATATTASLTMRNNILVNLSTQAGTGFVVAYQRSAVALANYNAASNNNLFYAGAASATNLLFYDGTNSAEDMATYQPLVASRDAASFSENVTFQNTTGASADFLKVDLATATQIESGGGRVTTPVAITTDYFGTIRALETSYAGTGTAPDIGAFEGNMTGLDLIGPSIVYTNLGNTGLTTNRTLNVTVSDGSGVPTSGTGLPRLFWRINAGSYTAVTAVHVSGSTYSFTFGNGTVSGDSVGYYVVAQDAAAANNVAVFPSGGASGLTNSPPNASTPPTTPSLYRIVPGFQGTYNVGVGEVYESLTGDTIIGFFRMLNAGVATGNIVLEITSDITESGAIALNQLVEDGVGGYTLTIRSNSATMKTFSGSFAGGLIRLNGADRVIIDGRSGGSGQFLTFRNNSVAANSAAIFLASNGLGAGSTNNTIRNCIIEAGSITVASTFGIHIGSSSISTAGLGADNDNNTITENTIRKAFYGIYAAGLSGAGVMNNLVVSNNTIGSSVATDVIANRGIRVGNADNAQITSNVVFGFRSASNTIQTTGIEFSSDVINSAISRNEIYDLEYTANANRAGQGISVNTVASSSVTISNNAIHSMGGHGSATALNNSWGILVLGGGGINIHYNTISISGTFRNSAANIHGGIYLAAAATGLNISNNVVNSQGAVGLFYNIYSLAPTAAYSNLNRNSYFIPTTPPVNTTRHIGFLTSERTSLTDWQTATSLEVNSINSDPLLNSNTNLRPGLGSPLLGAGEVIAGITTDFLGDARSGTPTIGAFENAVDLAVPNISFVTLVNTSSTGTRTLVATISDLSGVSTSGLGLPVLYYSVNSASGPFTARTATHTGGSSYSFNVDPTVVINDRVHYYIAAQDNSGTPNVGTSPVAGATSLTSSPPAAGTPPTTPHSYRIVNTFSGTILVGTGETFTTLTDNNGQGLFRAINDSLIVTGNVEVEITTDITETGLVALNQILEEGVGSYTITIKPSAAVLRNLTGTNASALVRFNAADRIIIDGRHGGTGNFLRFANSNAGTSSAVIWFNSVSGNGATNNTVRNVTVEGNASTTTLTGIMFSGSAMGAPAEVANSNNNVLNNVLRKAQYGVAAVGPTVMETGLVITGNTIGSTTVPADRIGFRGIGVFQQNGATISENTIQGVVRTNGDNFAAGIFVGGIQSASSITRNLISDVKNTNASRWGAQGIHLASSSFNNGITVANNVVYDVSGLGEPSNWADNGHGITISNGGGYNLHFNSVNLNTNQANNGNTAALFISSAAVTGLNITNNIFANSQTNSSRRAVYSLANDTSFTGLNYNLYRADTIGFIRDTIRINLANWQTATGKDGNSLSGNPLFATATNMRPLEGSPAISAGNPVGGITVDYLGTSRSVTNPSIGAYESVQLNIWNGTGLWTNAANWTLGVPGSAANATVNSGALEITAGATINDLTINNGATVDVPNVRDLTVNGALNNNGTINVLAGGNLVQGAAATIGGGGTFTARRNSGNGSNLIYNMWSSPNSVSTLSTVGGTDWFEFNATSQTWTNTGFTGNTAMAVGRGYSATGAGNVLFTGTYNNGAQSPVVSNSGAGFNLVGNPYPSTVSGTPFLAANVNIDGTLWFWSQPDTATANNSGGDYATWTTLGGTAGSQGGATPDGNIGLGQGFFVKANSGASISFTNSMRGTSAGSNFRIGAERAWFNLSGTNNRFNQILIGFSDAASDQRDAMDASKLKGNPDISFYSLMGTNQLAIQALAERATSTKVVPVGFDAAIAGTYSFSLDRTESMPANVDIFLKDYTTGNMYDLRNQAYTFNVSIAGSYTNRFEIHFGVGLTTSLANNDLSQARIYGAENTLSVDGLSENTVVEMFEVRDAAGRVVMQRIRPQHSDLSNVRVEVAAGIYLARIVTNHGTKVERIYLSK